MSAPSTAMVLAAGLGTRMRPLSDHKPKALIEVGGKALIDHTLDRLVEAGVTTAVVNVHAHAEQLIAHLDARAARDASMTIHISDERGALLETGGAVKKARALLGERPIWIANSDYVWIEGGEPPTLVRQAAAWDPERMDSLVLVTPRERTLGFETPGDFFRDEAGRLTRRGEAPTAPYHCFGVQIIDPRTVYRVAEDRFSLFQVWIAASIRGRLFGHVPDGLWMQVGDPQALLAVEARLRAASASAPGV
jgi:MurNAc alpha-1-phosphate uridylyltransferase